MLSFMDCESLIFRELVGKDENNKEKINSSRLENVFKTVFYD